MYTLRIKPNSDNPLGIEVPGWGWELDSPHGNIGAQSASWSAKEAVEDAVKTLLKVVQ